eukprot:2860528-Rhodomonas_salina.3
MGDVHSILTVQYTLISKFCTVAVSNFDCGREWSNPPSKVMETPHAVAVPGAANRANRLIDEDLLFASGCCTLGRRQRVGGRRTGINRKGERAGRFKPAVMWNVHDDNVRLSETSHTAHVLLHLAYLFLGLPAELQPISVSLAMSPWVDPHYFLPLFPRPYALIVQVAVDVHWPPAVRHRSRRRGIPLSPRRPIL